MRVIRPRADEFDPDEMWPGTDFQHTPGSASSYEDSAGMTEAERKRARAERRARLARKRPIGFAPWPEIDP